MLQLKGRAKEALALASFHRQMRKYTSLTEAMAIWALEQQLSIINCSRKNGENNLNESYQHSIIEKL